MNWIFKEMRSFIAPYFCGYCRTYLGTFEPLCNACILLIKPILSTTLSIDSRTKLQVHAVSAYEEPLASLILGKHRSNYEASIHLGTLIWRYSVMTSMSVDYLIPVPLHRRREAQRGYNQALVMAQQLSMLSGIPILDCVLRTKYTVRQSLLSRSERYDNVQNAFQGTCHASRVFKKRVLFIDDMMSSGTTLVALVNALGAYQPAHMQALVACGPCD